MIRTQILDRIAGSQLSGARLAAMLDNLAHGLKANGIPGGSILLDFTEPGDEFLPGHMIPTIQLTLRPAGGVAG